MYATSTKTIHEMTTKSIDADRYCTDCADRYILKQSDVRPNAYNKTHLLKACKIYS